MITNREMEFDIMQILTEVQRGQIGRSEAFDVIMDIVGSFKPRNSRSNSLRKPKRKLSAWNKYVKANSKKPRFRLRSGKINLKKMGVAFRKTPAGRKKK